MGSVWTCWNTQYRLIVLRIFCADSGSTVLHLSLLVVAAGESRALHLDHKNERRRPRSKQFCVWVFQIVFQWPQREAPRWLVALWYSWGFVMASWWLCASFGSFLVTVGVPGCACDGEVLRCSVALGGCRLRWSSEPWISRLDWANDGRKFHSSEAGLLFGRFPWDWGC